MTIPTESKHTVPTENEKKRKMYPNYSINFRFDNTKYYPNCPQELIKVFLAVLTIKIDSLIHFMEIPFTGMLFWGLFWTISMCAREGWGRGRGGDAISCLER